jgi:hypothetical protein
LGFAKRFIAASQELAIGQARINVDGTRRPCYTGIKLTKAAQGYVERQAMFDLGTEEEY